MPISQSWNPSRRAATGAGALVAAMTPMLALPSPASAHNVCSTHPSDPSTVCLTPTVFENTFVDHGLMVVCDRDADGNYAYARRYRNGVVQDPLYDQNGAAAGCSSYRTSPSTLESFNVCVQNEQCGRPVYKANY